MKENSSILVPIDLDKAANSVAALRFVHRMCAEPAIAATLLYVITLNIARAPQRVYNELASAGEAGLKELAKLFTHYGRKVGTSVRLGVPHEEIVAEAKSRKSELIVMSCPGPVRFGWFHALGTAGNVSRMAPCPTLILPYGGNLNAGRHKRLRSIDLAEILQLRHSQEWP